jgi:hypothetical protein
LHDVILTISAVAFDVTGGLPDAVITSDVAGAAQAVAEVYNA